jgi:DNA-directed RNA polymerase specialized sigma24 family protein
MNRPPGSAPLSPEDSDDSWLAACLAGNTLAWESLVARHEPRVRAVAGRLLGRKASWDLVEDIVANVWLLLWEDGRRRLQAFDPRRGSLEAYLSAVTRREVQRQCRAEPLGRVVVCLGTEEGLADRRGQNPDWGLIWDEFLSLLSARQRQFLQDELCAAAAGLGGMPLTAGSARKLRERVLAKLLRFLRDR